MADKETRVTVQGRYTGGALWTAKANQADPDRERFSACVVLNKGEDKKVVAAAEAAMTEKWGSKLPAGLQDWTVREGDDPEYTSSYEKQFINPKSTRPIQVVRKVDGAFEAVTKEDDVVYPGCYVAASIDVYCYDGDKARGVKPGVTISLRSVMFVKDGERLDDQVNAESEFSDVEVDEGEDDDFLAPRDKAA